MAYRSIGGVVETASMSIVRMLSIAITVVGESHTLSLSDVAPDAIDGFVDMMVEPSSFDVDISGIGCTSSFHKGID